MQKFDFNRPDNLKLVRKLTRPMYFSLFKFKKLPLMWYAGVKLEDLNSDFIRLKLPFQRSNLNPFGSMYFGAMVGAAELATGIPLLLYSRQYGNFSMLVKSQKSQFLKKAITDLTFKFSSFDKIEDAVSEAFTFQSASFVLSVAGMNFANEVVSHHEFEWSIRLSKH